MTLYLEPGRVARTGPMTRLGAGAQGIVFALDENPAVCLKFFLRPSPELNRRVTGLLRLRPSDWRADGEHLIAWPHWRLFDDDDLTRAVVLPRVAGTSLQALFDRDQRLATLAAPTWATCLEAALRIVRIFRQLHQVDVVVGDVSPGNLLVEPDGRVALIDCDSVQFADDFTRELFPAAVATREYCSPEALRHPLPVLAPSHDLFGLAVLVCQLLMDGDHPFEGVPVTGPDRGVAGNIEAGNEALFRTDRLVPVAGRLDRRVLPAAVQDLAYRALVTGHGDPRRRPTATEWEDVLRDVRLDLLGCPRGRHHFYPMELGHCVWCARADAGYGDHFPDRSVAPAADVLPTTRDGVAAGRSRTAPRLRRRTA